jgi:hypothetical protein
MSTEKTYTPANTEEFVQILRDIAKKVGQKLHTKATLQRRMKPDLTGPTMVLLLGEESVIFQVPDDIIYDILCHAYEKGRKSDENIVNRLVEEIIKEKL